jgi:hypothetical protein
VVVNGSSQSIKLFRSANCLTVQVGTCSLLPADITKTKKDPKATFQCNLKVTAVGRDVSFLLMPWRRGPFEMRILHPVNWVTLSS